MKYEVGDMVRLREDLVSGRTYGGMIYTASMKATWPPGSIVTIRQVHNQYSGVYCVNGHKEPWWTDKMFEGIVIGAEPTPAPEPKADWSWEDLF